MNRTTKVLALGCCLALIFCFYAAAWGAEAEPKVGQQVGAVKFKAPMSADDAKYLGLAKPEAFTLKDIQSPYVLVEQFNTSCPHCMHQAPFLNSLFNMVQQDAKLKDKIKFMAVAQGNEAPQLGMWKAFHKVPFPLIPDPDSSFGKALNFSPYPVTVVLDKSGKILLVHIGAFDNAEEVLKEIKKIAK
ncbi:MAG: TlpA disulfide reductase family protein [Pseudomonadota bacterium]